MPALPKIPIIEDLTKGQVPPGSNVLIEFDPASQWYNASTTIAAGWLRGGGKVSYLAEAQPPDDIRERLRMLGLNPESLEEADQLWITDVYTAGLIGGKPKEKFAIDSLKVSDLSIWMGKEVSNEPPAPDFLIIADNISTLDRFNEEKSWVEFVLARAFPMARRRRITQITGIIAGIHSERAYKQLEAAHAGNIDFTVEQVGGEWKNFITVRSMRDVRHDSRPHPLKVDENLQVTLEK